MTPAVRAAGAALAGTLLTAGAVLFDVRSRPSIALALLVAGKAGPAWEVIRADFPEAAQHTPADVGHDGQLFYAIAREPMRPGNVARWLDHPRYRLQRALLPWAAWALHPAGGGPGLVGALFAVGTLGLFVGGLASGLLAASLGGPPEAAALFPLLGGSFASLRITAADALATGLALAAVAVLARGRPRSAVVLGVLAVLAKETALLVLVGYAAWRRTRDAAAMACGAAAAGAGWWLWLRHAFAGDAPPAELFAPPLRGLAESVRIWASGEQTLAAVWVPTALVLAGLALVSRGRRHPLAPAILLQLGLVGVLSVDVLALDFNGPRASLPLLALALLGVAAPARPGR